MFSKTKNLKRYSKLRKYVKSKRHIKTKKDIKSKTHIKRKRYSKSKKNKQKGGSSELGNAYVSGGLLSTSYTLNNISPYDSALANPIPITKYSKCPS